MKKIFKIFLVLLVLFSSFQALPTQAAKSSDEFKVSAGAAIAVDVTSGKILYSQNATNSDQGIASITKLLTIYLVYEEIKNGKLSWEEMVPISDYAYNLTQNSVASNVPLAQGESISVKDLVNAALLPSANSAAIALAERIAGTEPAFVDMMKAQLQEWGITNAKIINSSGLPNEFLEEENYYPGTSASDENTMSAQDVAILSAHLLQDFPEVLEITKQTSTVFDKDGLSQTTINNTNYMLPGLSYGRDGVDGLKTGTTEFAGNCFVASSSQNGMQIITVVLDAEDDTGEGTARFSETNMLMQYVYSNWQIYEVSSAQLPVEEYPKSVVVNGKKKSVPLVAEEGILVVTKMSSPTYSYEVHKNKEGVEAPVTKGEVVATITTTVKDNLGYLPGFTGGTINLIANKSVDKANPLVIVWNNFVKFVLEEL
ncbi:MAG: serine hydrolase [Lactovum sp.]